MQRRTLLHSLLGSGATAMLAACASGPRVPAHARVVVVGGGFGGATAARYVREFSSHGIEVLLVEPQAAFVSCPVSNLVLTGALPLADITHSYAALESRSGVVRVQDSVEAIDIPRKTVRLARGDAIRYDKLVLSPGVELQLDAVPGLTDAQAAGRVLQAWKAGPETLALQRQLAAMPDGGVFVITVPEAPYRCPPGPYERASLVAAYCRQHKPRAKVLVLDANPDIVSKPALFRRAWAELYPGMVEYRPGHKVTAVDARTMTVQVELQDAVRGDVLNVLPPMRAGTIAVRSGLANSNGRWCAVDFQRFASTLSPDIHVLGDAIQAAPLMPKSAHMANAHAKVAAAAIVAELQGLAIDPQPMLTNTCYSYVAPQEAIHVASAHGYVPAEKTYRSVAGSGGVSAERSALEAQYARGWARAIWADTLGAAT